jgi:AraC family transcriptional regulator of adaptative response/methylated-DNA-[protein]-cysteine methyltransferase
MLGAHDNERRMNGKNSRRSRIAPAAVGKSPRGHVAGHPKEEICFGLGQSSLGLILVASSEKGVVAILDGEDEEELVDDLERRFSEARLVREDRDVEHLVTRVVGYIEAPSGRLKLPLDMRGTVFQQRVWQAVALIPAGWSMTYTDIAEKIGAPKAMRAVGTACSKNPFAFAVPCHRVMRNNGASCVGDGLGTERRRALLLRETATGAKGRSASPPTPKAVKGLRQ